MQASLLRTSSPTRCRDLQKKNELVHLKLTHSPLPRLLSFFVEVAQLHRGEQLLRRRGREAVGARLDDREPQSLDRRPHAVGGVVPGVVPQKDRVLLPPRRLHVQPVDEVLSILNQVVHSFARTTWRSP